MLERVRITGTQKIVRVREDARDPYRTSSGIYFPIGEVDRSPLFIDFAVGQH